MRKFILKSLIFLIIFVVILYAKSLFLLFKNQYQSIVLGSEIYHSITKSKQKRKTKKLLLGDSVANQLFSNTEEKDSITSLACNQSISLAGQYVLLNNYIKAGNKIEEVYIMLIPFSFQNNLNQVYTFHYFLKPFYTEEYQPLMSKNVQQQVKKIPYYYLSRNIYILTSNWAPDFEPSDKKNYSFISPISGEYLNKIKKLSVINNFKIKIISPPLSISNRRLVDKMNQNEIIKYNLTQEFGPYFKKIKYMADEKFKDGTHFKEPEKIVGAVRRALNEPL